MFLIKIKKAISTITKTTSKNTIDLEIDSLNLDSLNISKIKNLACNQKNENENEAIVPSKKNQIESQPQNTNEQNSLEKKSKKRLIILNINSSIDKKRKRPT